MSFDCRTQCEAFRIYATFEEVLRVDCINVLLFLIPQSFDWLNLLQAILFIAVLLRVILHRAPPQVADRGTLSRYRGYWGNKIPKADQKTDL